MFISGAGRLGDPEITDGDLLDRFRAGEREAYAELWRRHAHRARVTAGYMSATIDPDDLVAEAFVSILGAIERGKGPYGEFRPYLHAAMRNLVRSSGVKSQALSFEDLPVFLEPIAPDAVADVDDRLALIRALADLPPRWREVLWYTEVQMLKPRDIAEMFRLNANGASALIYRARSGLRAAWINIRAGAASRSEACHGVGELVLAGRPESAWDAPALVHLRACDDCRDLVAEIDRIRGRVEIIEKSA